ncbi:putative ATP-grasp enzyme [Planoprotostelium fungivorum]|uniref:Putative ATP-grasp enzyme n=1 Tax=Planoprotostelium fungivorum TaxID=1890364 RepID=A0A2P6MX27_9EUKA|nr:putative ATP-grasp enzyme [Planoprotostelium fungivorum]
MTATRRTPKITRSTGKPQDYNPTYSQHIVKNVFFIAVSLLFLPLSTFLLVSCLVIRHFQKQPQPIPNGQRKTVLVNSGRMTKSLVLLRKFKEAGHRVILVEEHSYWFCANRWSNSVDAFYRIGNPLVDLNKYTEDLIKVIKAEGVDYFILVSHAGSTIEDGIAKKEISKHCEVFQFDEDTCRTLHEKHRFIDKARGLGFVVPESHHITVHDQVLKFDFKKTPEKKFILKCIGLDPLDDHTRSDMTLLPLSTPERTSAHVKAQRISESNPWVLQEFIQGEEYCTHSTVRGGQVRAFVACPSSELLVNYYVSEKPKMLEFTQKFASKMNLTGQLAFDFIETADGSIYPIECNPRTHTAITLFYNHPHFAASYVPDSDDDRVTWPVQPLMNSPPVYWIGHELFSLFRTWDVKTFLERLVFERDGTFSIEDPWPHFLLYHFHWPFIFLKSLIEGKKWSRINVSTSRVFLTN